MSEPRDVFTSEPLSVERVMMEPGRGFYVPSYQRPYAWKIDNVASLLTNIAEGLGAVRDMEDAITFIGTLIFVHDTQYRTVEPQVRNDLPMGVFLVIDGQQRLTSITLMMVALHDAIRRLEARVSKQGVTISWLERLGIELKNRLEEVLLIDKKFGQDHFRYYPRIIRAHDDSWSCSAGDAKYVSPTASVLAAYIKYIKVETKPPTSAFKWAATGAAPEDRVEEFKLVERTLKYIGQYLDRLSKAHTGEEEEEASPEQVLKFHGLSDSEELQLRYFKNVAPVDITTYWKDGSAPHSDVNRLCRVLMFTRYLLERVAVTQVLVKREEYAFDLFEALNTTGEPLTAYETFRPLVIKTEKLELFKASPSAKHMAVVERFLGKFADDRAKASDRVLIPFALLEKGAKLGKHLRDQRNWLRRSYDESGLNTESKRSFLRGMSVVAQFLTDMWEESDGSLVEAQLAKLGSSPTDRRDIKLCMRVLVDSKHEITVALLARFYEFLLNAADEASRTKAASEFAEAVRAVVGFFALWRGSRVGTENIDQFYRKLMLDGLPPEPAPFRRNEPSGPTAARLRACMQHWLEEKAKGITKRAGWVDRAWSLTVYTQSRELSKLLLLAAAHDEIPDEQNPGLTKAGKPDACPTLNFDHWTSDLDIEHISPQKTPLGGGGWAQEIYSKDLQNALGNLILLPPDSNRSAGNKSWKVKSIYYRVISTADPAAVSQLIAAAAAEGVAIAAPTQELLSRAGYLPHLRALQGLADGDWTAAFVERRSRNMAEKAWARLAPWVGLAPGE